MSNNTPSNEFVTDTMALILWLERRKLPQTIKTVFQRMEQGNAVIYVPTMTLAEILYLSEKQRISLTIEDTIRYIENQSSCKEYAMNIAVIQATAEITDIPELHDRLIAATARVLDAVLMTNDPVIQISGFVKTVW